MGLQISMLNLGKISDFLDKALEPPPREAIDQAIELLQELQVVTATAYRPRCPPLLSSSSESTRSRP